MAKIGTAHVEIKPVLNEEALASIVARIEADVAAAVGRALGSTVEPGLAERLQGDVSAAFKNVGPATVTLHGQPIAD